MDKIHFRAFYTLIVGTGIAIITLAVASLTTEVPQDFYYYIGLSIVLESLVVRIRPGHYFTLGYGLAFCMIIIYQPLIAALISAVGVFFSVIRVEDGYRWFYNYDLTKHAFNTSVIAIVVYASASVYKYMSALFPSPIVNLGGIGLKHYILALVTFTFLQIVIFAILFSIIGNTSITKSIKGNLWMLINLFTVSPIGLLMAFTQMQLGFLYVLIFLGPLLVARFIFTMYIETRTATLDMIESLTRVLETKDPYTVGHSARVSEYAEALARHVNLPSIRVERVRIAGLLHDIGKTGISELLLNKRGKLTAEEYNIMKQHPEMGYDIIKDNKMLSVVADFVLYHHEYYDGNGYPKGLSGSDIPIEAAIISIVDAYDAMTSDRSYRKAYPMADALRIISDAAGKQFDPKLAASFCDMIIQFEEAKRAD